MTLTKLVSQESRTKRHTGRRYRICLPVCFLLILLVLAGCGSSKNKDDSKSGDMAGTTERPMTAQERALKKQEEALKFLDQVFDWYNGQDAESLAGNMSSKALAAQNRSVKDQEKIYEEEFGKDKISLVKKENFQIQDLQVWGLRTYYTYDGTDRELAFVAFEEDGKWVYCNYEGFSKDYLD